MSLVLQFGNNGGPEEISAVYYINVVESYTKNVNGKLSKHPLDSGVSISDHFISENMTFNIRGVITSADITFAAYTTSFAAVGANNIERGEPPIAVTVDTGKTLLNKFLPDVIGQFLSPVEAEVFGDESEVVETGTSFSEFIERMILDVIYNPTTQTYRNSIVPVSLYEMEGSQYSKAPYTNLVVTDFKVNETPDTGNGCHFDMTLEQARFVELRKEALPDDVAAEIKRQSQPTSNKGKAGSTEKEVVPDGKQEEDPTGPFRIQSKLDETIFGKAAGTRP